jgi:hypothetical protein
VLANEEGKLKNLPYNNRATLEWGKCTGQGGSDHLVGDVVVLTGNARKRFMRD